MGPGEALSLGSVIVVPDIALGRQGDYRLNVPGVGTPHEGGACGLAPQHALLVEGWEGPLRVVFRLQLAVNCSPVALGELLGGVIALRVERFDALQFRDDLLDTPIQASSFEEIAPAHDVPKAEIDVELARHGKERKARGVGPRHDRADPDRTDADLG